MQLKRKSRKSRKSQKYLVLCLLLFSLKSNAQSGGYLKKNISKTEIEVVYSHYLQDGENSAVTGGIGTEKLVVYSPSLKISHSFSGNTISLYGGVDVISSPSTDNIDYVVSSASILDGRTHGTLSYSRYIENIGLLLGISGSGSIESDYSSLSSNIFFDYTFSSQMSTLQGSFSMFFDDLRWGRLSSRHREPVKLIYPSELRGKEWYDEYLRNSFNLKVGYTQILNNRMALGIFPQVSYQQGLLATPFHRVYFEDETLSVEKLPNKRLKILLGSQLNLFLGDRYIIKPRLSFYWDTFGITSGSAEIITSIKLLPQLIISPFARIYLQSGSPYFKGYREHKSNEGTFYTSDYDLSSFQTYKTGINLKYAPAEEFLRWLLFNELQLRYTFLYRSNNLHAHTLTVSFLISTF